MDAFSKRSLLYLNAVSTAPVCAPAALPSFADVRSLRGRSPHAFAGPQTRLAQVLSRVPARSGILLHEQLKTDYNIDHNIKEIWDESSGKAHYKNRNDGQPFFAIFNQTCTHESRIRSANAKTIHDPAKAVLPPYHPDTPEVRSTGPVL